MPIADDLCVSLSMLFGKRFDNHGYLESRGYFGVPDLSSFQSAATPQLPQHSSAPREDLEIPLNLEETARIAPILATWLASLVEDVELSPDQASFHQHLSTAAQFYWQALQDFERRREMAYLSLITSGEVLATFCSYEPDDLLDFELAADIGRIKTLAPDGPAIAARIRRRLKQVKRRFVKTLCALTNSYCFAQSQGLHERLKLQKADFAARIGAAYDLRSQYVHTGIAFGGLDGRTR